MDFNPYSRRLHANPYPAYASLQERSPVYYNERFGFWVISRYDDVQAALKDWRTFSSASGITVQSFTGLKPMIILMDPPRQAELRALLQRAFHPRRNRIERPSPWPSRSCCASNLLYTSSAAR
jgi:cytochrome P450